MIGQNVFDMVHPGDHCELQSITNSRCPSVVSRPPAVCYHSLCIRMRSQLTKGYPVTSKSFGYRVRFVSLNYDN